MCMGGSTNQIVLLYAQSFAEGFLKNEESTEKATASRNPLRTLGEIKPEYSANVNSSVHHRVTLRKEMDRF